MNILVIGNGFDIAHNLKTQYIDFLDFVKAIDNSGDDNDYASFISDIKNHTPALYSEIVELKKDNVLLDYFLSIYEERGKKGKRGWIDFESEISDIVQKLDRAKIDVSRKISGPNDSVQLDKALFQYLKPIIEKETNENGSYITSHQYQPRFFDYQADRVLDALNRLTRLLEIYLFEYIEKRDCILRLPDIIDLKIERVLSFNYTDIYRKYYDPDGRIKYCFVHGKTRNDSAGFCNLILGIDEYLPAERINDDNQFVWFKKFYQRIYKETGSEYLDWASDFEGFNEVYKKAKPSHMDIYFYGHSLDVTDKDILSRLIMMKNTTTHIFYHNREAMAKQISNLVKIIGEDNLIRMTGGKDRSIVFIQSKPAIDIQR